MLNDTLTTLAICIIIITIHLRKCIQIFYTSFCGDVLFHSFSTEVFQTPIIMHYDIDELPSTVFCTCLARSQHYWRNAMPCHPGTYS